MLLGKRWSKINIATHDYLANTYTIERDTKYVLMAMEKNVFKTWRKERLQKMKEQEETKKEAKATEFFSTHVQYEDYDYTGRLKTEDGFA